MATKPVGSDPNSYGAKLRSKGVQVNTAGMVRQNSKPPAPHRYNQWEKGRAYEERPGGTRMPILDKNMGEIPIKTWTEGKYRDAVAQRDRARAVNTKR